MTYEDKWQALKMAAKAIREKKLLDLFLEDPQRVDKFSMKVGEIYWDYLKILLPVISRKADYLSQEI